MSKKGYNGGFIIGFLLSIIGFIYSVDLPDRSAKIINDGNKKMIAAKNSDCEQEDFTICKNCGFQIFSDENCCNNYGKPKNKN